MIRKSDLLLLALVCVLGNSVFAIEYNDINFPKDPAYRLRRLSNGELYKI